MRLLFLGTGASGGTAGRGRSRRRESSALLSQAETRILIDVTRDFSEQRRSIRGPLHAVLLTHGHRDACGGLPALRAWMQDRCGERIPVYASAATIKAVRRRFKRLDHCELVGVREGQRRRIGPWTVTAVTVPHARERSIPTFAWRLTTAGRTLVYASDVARLTPRLRRFASGASLLVIDGAMWGRTLFSHLTIDRELPGLCGWRVQRILLTQIGKTAPPHARLAGEVQTLCPRAAPAHDGLSLRL
jgi:phosphoribosyl 1,2-cyclic phosphodiesterase